MSCDYNGQAKDDDVSIMFSERMDWQSVPTNASDVTVFPVPGTHQSGSSQIKVKNIVDSAWEKTFHWGNLVATHYKGNYFAYALTVPGKSAGMIRVLRNDSNDRILLKGFHGFVRDLAFAFHEHRILLGAIDEYGYLLVHEIIGSNSEMILQVVPPTLSSSENHRIVWCPYVPENTDKSVRSDFEDHALLLAVSHDKRVEVWHVGRVNGTVGFNSVTIGASQIDGFEGAVVDIAFSPDSTAVALASLDGFVRFFMVNTTKEQPKMLHKWQPHEGKQLSGIIFLDNLSHPNIGGSPLWKWAVTSAENNTEIKLWSCELWDCHQTIRFQSDSMPIFQKMALDLSASFLLLSDIHRKVLYVMHVEQEEKPSPEISDPANSSDRTISKVTSITQILLPFSPISIAICEAAFKESLTGLEVADEYDADEKPGRVVMKLLVVQPKSLQKCKATFELGTAVPLGEGLASSSFSTLNTTSEYEPNIVKPPAQKPFNLLTPDAFVSPAKVNSDEDSHQPLQAAPPTSVSTPGDILALSSPRRPTPEVTTSIVPRRNGIQSGGSSPSREVEEILGTRPIVEAPDESPDISSAAVPTGSALHEALAAYPVSLSPANPRSSSTNSNDRTPPGEKYEAPLDAEQNFQAPTSTVVSSSTPLTIPSNGNLMELFKEVLAIDTSPQQSVTSTQIWPIAPLVANHITQPTVRTKESPVETDLPGQLSIMQQTLNHMLQLLTVQQAEQLKMKNEISQLRTEVSKLQSVGAQQSEQTSIAHLESVIGTHFDRHLKKIDEINSPAKTQQTISKLQNTIRTEFESKTNTFEQKSVDFFRKELQAVISSEMSKMEPVLKNSTMQLLTHLSQNKTIVETYSHAASTAAITAVNRSCKETISQNLLPSVERMFQQLFNQLNDTFSKGISEFVRSIETNLDRHRRLQDKESQVQLSASVEKMSTVLEQVRNSIATETKNELRKLALEVPEKVRDNLTPLLRVELQSTIRDQKTAFEGALIAVQQAAQVQARAITPAISVSTPVDVPTQLKLLIQEGRYSEAFQRALSLSDLNMVMFVCQRVDPFHLFSAIPRPLSQPVLLSLIQQLAADLSTSLQLKLDYLQEAAMAVDFHDPISKEHGPKVMALLASKLQQEVIANPSGPLCRQMRLLILATQPLARGKSA